jgi:hypothetical protein
MAAKQGLTAIHRDWHHGIFSAAFPQFTISSQQSF